MRALVRHEFEERLRDRWVLVVTALFVMLSAGVGLYGRSAGESAAAVTAPSIVTLAALLVPLVALVLGHDAIVGERERHTLGLLLSLPVGRGEVLLAKFLGRAMALVLSIVLGLGSAIIVLDAEQASVLVQLLPSTLLLGAAFLSIGMFLSTMARRHATAASLSVAVWFLFVFFYDLGILAALIITDGALSTQAVADMVLVNPAGLYRTEMLVRLGAGSGLENLGVDVVLPGAMLRTLLWACWIVVPQAAGAFLLRSRRAVQS